MKERPILFNAEMVRAVLDGRKTQTRRVLKQVHTTFKLYGMIGDEQSLSQRFRREIPNAHPQDVVVRCPYGKVGDRLWVRETFCECSVTGTNIIQGVPVEQDAEYIEYRADGQEADAQGEPRWTPSIFMPRAASRINLEITDIRVERVQDISEKDAEAEGVEQWCDGGYDIAQGYRISYCALWDSINKKCSLRWDMNPWVWVVEFKRITN